MLQRGLLLAGALAGGGGVWLAAGQPRAPSPFGAAQCEGGAASVFDWPEMRKAVQERQTQERELRAVSLNAQQRLQEITRLLKQGKVAAKDFEARFEALRKEIVDRAEQILYGANGREQYIKENGCVKISQTAIDVIKRLKQGVVEMGAGAGHWSKALKEHGVDVIAYDSMESPPLSNQQNVFNVQRGGPEALSKHSNRALLVVYPPPGPMAMSCLEAYKGNVVVYCGEGRGGANGNEQFFDRLDKDFVCESTVTDFERFGTKNLERMWVMRRSK